MKRFLLLALTILITTSCSQGSGGFQASEQSFVSGNGIVTVIKASDREVAPELRGPTLDGGNYSGVPDRVEVMNVWASWCSPCRAEAPALQELSVKYPSAQFVGVLTRDSLVPARAFVDRFGITYPTIVDDAILAKFSGLLSVNAIPTTLIIDKQGRLAARISGEITYSSMADLLEKLTNE
jgi:thiol-disulfide isomerase/thioredoxin